ncbi:MAG TPA: hypothetical protein VEU33_50205 [Archangium sp.]|nr:hypothetical protein [Archangium sp.]
MMHIYKQAFLATLLGGLFVTGTAGAQQLTTGDSRYGPFWGGVSGHFAYVNCAPGSVAVGLSGTAGALVDSVRLICAPLTSSGSLDNEKEYYAGGAGGDSGGVYQLKCNAGYALEGIYGNADIAIDRLGIRCRSLDWAYSYTAGHVGGTGGNYFWDHIYPGQFVTGFSARVGTHLGANVVTGIAARYSNVHQ